MKNISLPIFIGLVLCFRLQAQTGDTTIKGVSIYFQASTQTAFPREWQSSPTSATSVRIETGEISRSLSAVSIALIKYPAWLLEMTLKSVYFFKTMSFFNVTYGGTNSSNAVYITNGGVPLGFTDAYLEQTFHHEYSSILIRGYARFLDTVAWKAANIPGFDYNDPEAGVGAIKKNESSQEIDTALCRKGFITQYSCSSMENDINTIAQNLFRPDKNFWIYADKYPRIRKKVNLLISFYGKLDKSYTEACFRLFENQE